MTQLNAKFSAPRRSLSAALLGTPSKVRPRQAENGADLGSGSGARAADDAAEDGAAAGGAGAGGRAGLSFAPGGAGEAALLLGSTGGW